MNRARLGLLLVVYAAFVALGLPDTVLGTAWPVMHGDFGVSLAALGVLGVVGALSAVASSLVYGRLAHRPAPWQTLVGTTALMAVAMVGLGLAGQWWQVVLVSALWGLCGGGIDIELNHFASQHFSRRHMSWLHGCWGVGAAAGPLLMAAALQHSGRWPVGFWLLAATMGGLALAFGASRGLWPAAPADAHAAHAATPTTPTTAPTSGAPGGDAPAVAPPPPAPDHPPPARALWLSPLVFFLVVAAEFATAVWIPSIMTAGHGLAPAAAGQWATLFFGALMAGRFLLGALGDRLGNRLQVRLGIAAAWLGAAGFVLGGASTLGAAGLLVMGLGAAPLFPALMHETSARFSRAWSARMVARQMTGAYLAGALMPLAYAALVDRVGVAAIMPTAMGLLALLALATLALDRATPPLVPPPGAARA